ncbi:MAG TPA: toll/interleukin-1 receptor domain-containing protein [Candidatus Binataceae bacterium]|nr:toll/interleukin-1 receptor domain-containing protein [Candidatus Binataceae bacterium]
MAHDVFISYSSRDKTVADAACARLEADGIRCWIAPRDILPGMDWGGAIIEAIEGARLMLLVLSASADESPQILREVERAVNKGLRIVPLRIEDVKPGKSLEYFLGTPHWLDAITPPLERHLEYLVQTARTLLNNQELKLREAMPLRQAPPKPARWSRRSIIVAAGAILLSLIGIVLLWWFMATGPAAGRFVGAWSATNENGPGKTHFTLEIGRGGSYTYQVDYQEAGEVRLRNGRIYLDSDDGVERDVGAPAAGTTPPVPANLVAAVATEVWGLIGRFCGVAVARPAGDPFRQVGNSGTAGAGEPSVWEWYPTFGTVVWRIRLEFTAANYQISASAVDAGQFTADKGFWSASSSVLRTTTGGNYSFVGGNAMVMTGTVRGALRTTANGQTLWERTQPVALAQITPRVFPSQAATALPTSVAASATPAESPSASPTPKMMVIDKHFFITNDTPVYSKADMQSATIGYFRRRRRIHAIGFMGSWLKIAMNNGGVGFIPVSAVE